MDTVVQKHDISTDNAFIFSLNILDRWFSSIRYGIYEEL